MSFSKIYETLETKVDIKKLQDFVEKKAMALPPVMQGKCFGGWSILSSDNSYKDGWVHGSQAYDKGVYDPSEVIKQGLKPSLDYCKPTELCTGYMEEVINLITNLGFEPTRARLTILKAGGESSIHRDAQDNEYAIRIHIPVFTNPMAVFEKMNVGTVHLPADGSIYVMGVNCMHQIRNPTDQDRIHLLMDACDNNNVTQHFGLDSWDT